MMLTSAAVKVLLIEDNPAEARLLQEILKGSQLKEFSLTHVKRLEEALERLKQDCFDAILLDLTLPDSEGLKSLAPLLEQVPHLPIVVLTNTNDDALALEAVRQGAQDYLVKRQVNLDVLVRSLCYAIERQQAAEELREMNERLAMRIEERTAELVKAKEQNQLKTEFVSMLSHDFRNPLNTIMLSTGLLEGNSDRLTQEQKIGYFRLIRSAIKNMDQLLSEVLLIGRVDAGKLQCDFIYLDIEAFCREVVDALKLNHGEKHQVIFTPRGVFQEALWDESLLRHILHNLVGNAIKYSPAGGVVHFDLIGEENQVIFRIQDRGIGIPREYLKHLFQPFRRASNVDNIPGTGLGLAIVKRCVETHGGQVAIESQVGVGTTFTVTLPLLQETVPGSPDILG